jgi:hypothetical protein
MAVPRFLPHPEDDVYAAFILHYLVEGDASAEGAGKPRTHSGLAGPDVQLSTYRN